MLLDLQRLSRVQSVRPRPVSYPVSYLSRADPSQDHSRALQSCIMGPPRDWRRRVGRPRQSWLRTVEDDLRPLNFGLATARRRAMDRLAWRLLVETATST